jgi:hypothetical protein
MPRRGTHPRQGEWCLDLPKLAEPVKLIFENLEDGMTIDEIVEQYPVSREEIKAVLDFAAHSLDVAPGF